MDPNTREKNFKSFDTTRAENQRLVQKPIKRSFEKSTTKRDYDNEKGSGLKVAERIKI